MVTQNHFVMPATVLEKLRSRGFPEGVTVTAQDYRLARLHETVVFFPIQFSVLKKSEKVLFLATLPVSVFSFMYRVTHLLVAWVGLTWI